MTTKATAFADPIFRNSTLPTNPAEIERLFQGYKPRHFLDEHHNGFHLKIASTSAELADIFRLRHSVFIGKDDPTDLGWEMDLFDLRADHLMLIEEATGELAGTYRLLSGKDTRTFYSQSEFRMDFLERMDGDCLEFGRACIHQDHRRGTALSVLWRGLGQCISQSQPIWLFGCSSTKLTSLEEASRLRALLLQEYLSPPAIRAWPTESLPLYERYLSQDELNAAEDVVPALLRSYLRLGARVCGEPCWDPEFETLDYLTLVHVPSIPERHRKRFGITR